MPSAKMHRVLITGAGGRIGRGLRETLRGVYPILRLSDLVPIAEARDGEEVDQTNIADVKAAERMVQGCHVDVERQGAIEIGHVQFGGHKAHGGIRPETLSRKPASRGTLAAFGVPPKPLLRIGQCLARAPPRY